MYWKKSNVLHSEYASWICNNQCGIKTGWHNTSLNLLSLAMVCQGHSAGTEHISLAIHISTWGMSMSMRSQRYLVATCHELRVPENVLDSKIDCENARPWSNVSINQWDNSKNKTKYCKLLMFTVQCDNKSFPRSLLFILQPFGNWNQSTGSTLKNNN